MMRWYLCNLHTRALTAHHSPPRELPNTSARHRIQMVADCLFSKQPVQGLSTPQPLPDDFENLKHRWYQRLVIIIRHRKANSHLAPSNRQPLPGLGPAKPGCSKLIDLVIDAIMLNNRYRALFFTSYVNCITFLLCVYNKYKFTSLAEIQLIQTQPT